MYRLKKHIPNVTIPCNGLTKGMYIVKQKKNIIIQYKI